MGRRAIWVPWDQQPQEAARLDLGHPLASGLFFGYTGGLNRDLVSGALLTLGTAGVRGVDGDLAGDFNGSSQYLGAAIPSRTLVEHTLFALVQGNSPGTDRRLFTFGSSSTDQPITQIGTGSSNANRVRLWWRNTSGTSPTEGTSSGDVFNQGRPVAVVQRVSYDGISTFRAYGFVNGVADGFSAGTTPSITVDRVSIGALLRASPSSYFAGSVLLAYAWDRPLPDDEILRISLGPRQLFEPRRVWVPVGAAGGAENLTIAEASHGHTADGLSLTSSSHLSVSDASHAHSADNLGLSSASHLTVADATHGHTAENLTLDTSATLSVADATHAHAADALTLTSASHLAVADSTHAQSADNVDLNAGANLVVQDATHSHSADVLALTSQSILVINDATHAHTADQVAWVTDQPRRGRGRNYIIKGRRYYNLTNEELAYLIGRDLIDVQRADVKVQYTNKRKTIPKNAWAEVEQTLARLNRFVDDEEAAMLLL